MKQIYKWGGALCALSFIQTASLFAEIEAYDHEDYRTQSNSEIENIEYGTFPDGREVIYKVQSGDRYLYLGPNEVFFNPPGGLRLRGETDNEAQVLNRKREYDKIIGFRIEGSALEWGLFTTQKGALHGDFYFEPTRNYDLGTELLFQIDKANETLYTITQEDIDRGYCTVDFSSLDEGPHLVKITLVKQGVSSGMTVKNFRLSGPGIKGAYILRERWRPEAHWSMFQSSKNPDDVQAWVFELRCETELGFYSPISTNFGYFGPIFKDDGSADRMNMSVWSSNKSFARPHPEKSHLLGIGSPEGRFSWWSHEGHGVKVRGWDNFSSNTSKRYVIGLRYENDHPFRTFYGYFWDEVKKKWTLYSIGRTFREALDQLKLTSFVEVLGGTESERTGQIPRTVEYKGWVCNSNGEWNDIDRIRIKKTNKPSNKIKGITEDGERFFTTTGGFKNYPISDETYWLEKEEILERPLYMQPKKLAGIYKIPFKPTIKSAILDSSGTLKVSFRIMTKHESKVTICYGSENAQTNERYWENSAQFDIPAGKRKRTHVVEILNAGNAKFVRLLVQNSVAQMWNFEDVEVLPAE